MISVGANLSSYASYANLNSGTVYVPVNSNQVIYSQFDHVSGIPVDDGQSGVTVKKLQILNHLIDQLVSMKKITAPTEAEQTELKSLTDTQLDSRITDYRNMLQTALDQAQNNPYAMTSTASLTGMVVDVEV